MADRYIEVGKPLTEDQTLVLRLALIWSSNDHIRAESNLLAAVSILNIKRGEFENG